MVKTEKGHFDSRVFLSTVGPGRTIVRYTVKGVIFPQGDPADSVFFLQSGRAKLAVLSKRGKEATVTQLAVGDFFGEESMSGEETLRTSTASAVTACLAMRIERREMLRLLHEEQSFSDFFMRFILTRGIRTQADLIDQLFNSSERRLARTLLIMAAYGKAGEPQTLIPQVTQETLAEMIGTTRSRVSYFMNRFRERGYIEYKSRIRVNTSLLSVVLHDEFPEENASRPNLLDPSHGGTARAAKGEEIV
jgi:CRP-like cAMP-binding protein